MCKKLTLTLTDTQRDSITEMAQQLQISKADLIRKALSLMSTALAEQAVGNRLAVTGSDGWVLKLITV